MKQSTQSDQEKKIQRLQGKFIVTNINSSMKYDLNLDLSIKKQKFRSTLAIYD